MTLQDDIASDLSDVFYKSGAGEFERSAAYTPVTGSPATVQGELIENTEADDNPVNVGDRVAQPTFSCASADVPNAAKDDVFVIDSVTYNAVAFDTNNNGEITTFILERQ